jgi:hypothetical protein
MELYKLITKYHEGMDFDAFEQATRADVDEWLAERGLCAVPAAVVGLIDQLVEFTFDGCGVDGGDLQEMLHHAGILEEYTAKEACCPDCVCQEVDDFPMTCYRYSSQYKAMLQAAKGE